MLTFHKTIICPTTPPLSLLLFPRPCILYIYLYMVSFHVNSQVKVTKYDSCSHFLLYIHTYMLLKKKVNWSDQLVLQDSRGREANQAAPPFWNHWPTTPRSRFWYGQPSFRWLFLPHSPFIFLLSSTPLLPWCGAWEPVPSQPLSFALYCWYQSAEVPKTLDTRII